MISGEPEQGMTCMDWVERARKAEARVEELKRDKATLRGELTEAHGWEAERRTLELELAATRRALMSELGLWPAVEAAIDRERR